jgi:hypothetical protein
LEALRTTSAPREVREKNGGRVSLGLEDLTAFADLLAAAGVIASLIFVAFEIRRNTEQTKQANWANVADRFSAVYAQTDDIELAKIVVRGRQSYEGLSEAERLAFGHYLEQLCIALESLLVHGDSLAHGRDAMLALAKKHLAFHLSFPGAREWYEEFDTQRGFPPRMREFVREAIES